MTITIQHSKMLNNFNWQSTKYIISCVYQILVCTCSQRCYNPNLTQAWPSQILMFSICTSLFHSQLLKVFTLQHHDLCQYLFDKRLEAKGSMAVFLQPWLSIFYANLISLQKYCQFDLHELWTSTLF